MQHCAAPRSAVAVKAAKPRLHLFNSASLLPNPRTKIMFIDQERLHQLRNECELHGVDYNRASIAPTLHAGAASPCGAAWITTGDKPLLPIAACITGSSGVDTTTARAPQCPSMYA
ncbi:hypothetical protein D9M71_515290 [compost metagenome]